MVGIYMIKNLISGKVYIGKSIDIKTRWRDHLRHLRKNTHHSKHLQNSFNKYGESVFVCGIIEEYPKELLDSKEKYWIDYYDSYNKGYNEEIPTGVNNGRIYTEENRRILSEAMKLYHSKLPDKIKKRRRKLLDEARKKAIYTSKNISPKQRAILLEKSKNTLRKKYGKKIYGYDKDTLELKYTFGSVGEFNDYINPNKHSKFSAKRIREIEVGKREAYKGHIWLREGVSLEDIPGLYERYYRKMSKQTKPVVPKLTKEEFSKKQKANSDKARQKLIDNKTYIYHVYTEDGVFMKEFYVLSDVSDFVNIPTRRLRKVMNRGVELYRGYKIQKIK